MANDILLKLETNIKTREKKDKPVINWFIFILLTLLSFGVYGFYIFKKRIDIVVEYSKRKYEFFELTARYLQNKIDNSMTIKYNNLLTINNSNTEKNNADIDTIYKNLHDFYALVSNYIENKINNDTAVSFRNLLSKFYYNVYKKNIENYNILRLIYFLCVLFFMIVLLFFIPFIMYLIVPEVFYRVVKGLYMVIVYTQAVIVVLSFITLLYGLYHFYLYASQMSKTWDDIQAVESDMYSLISDVLIKQDIIKEPLKYKTFYYNINSRKYFLITLVTLGIWGLVWDYKIHIMPKRLYKNLHNAEDEVLKALQQF